MRGAGSSIEDGIERYNRWSDGQHFPDASNHAATILLQLGGLVSALRSSASDDVPLFAYQLRDFLPEIQGYVNRLKQWSDEMIESDPYGLPAGRAT